MKKNVMKLDNEPLDEEFEKLVQGFLADEKSSDDSDTDDEDTDEDGDADDEGGDNGVPIALQAGHPAAAAFSQIAKCLNK